MAQPPSVTRQFGAPVDDPNCTYTMELLSNWADLLICVKDKGYYVGLGIQPKALNIALGTVLSAMNYPTFPCHFKDVLDGIQNMIIVVQASGKC